MSQIEALQTQIAEQEARLRLAELQQQATLAETYSRLVPEAWGDLVDPYERMNDSPGFGLSRLGRRISRPGDRARGRFEPHFSTEQDLAEIRGLARWLCATNETAIGAKENLTNYIVGNGFAYEATPAEEFSGSDAAAKLVQAVLDECHEANQWRQLERELFGRSVEDGEFCVAVECYDRVPYFKVVEPDYLTQPVQTNDLDETLGAYSLDWLFGIGTEHGNTMARRGYFVQWEGEQAAWNVYPAEFFEHFVANVPRGVKRGISDFYAVDRMLERAGKLLRNSAEGASIQAAIAYVKEHAANTTASQATNLAGAKISATIQQRGLNGRTQTTNVRNFQPGTTLDLSAGQKFVNGPMGAENAGHYIAIQQAVLRTVGCRWNMPEYMISGDASNGNYASSLVAESPFVKSAQAKQATYGDSFRALMWKAVRAAYGHGRFQSLGMSFAELRKAVKIDVTPPPVATRNRTEETAVNTILHDKGILSRKTWAAKEDLDYEAEIENGAAVQGQYPSPANPASGEPGTSPAPTPTVDELAATVREAIERGWEGYP